MDKRWILILLILIAGLFSLYHIVETSTTVGHAITVLDKVVVTLPSGFTNFDSHEKYVGIENKNNDEKIFVHLEKKGNSTDLYENRISKLKASWDIQDIKNKTGKINNITVKTVYYKNSTENLTEHIESYFDEFNSTFSVRTWGFENATQAESNIQFIIETLHIDYKQPK